MKKNNAKKGFSLIETVIYISILSIITFVSINTLFSFSRTYREIRMSRAIENSAVISMERMVREIRSATNVVVGQSTFNAHPGVLTLNLTNGSLSTTTRFYMTNGNLRMDINGVYSGPLTLSNVSVTSLIFNRLTSSSAEGVKIDMTIQYANGVVTKTKTYHTTVILK